MGHNEIGTQFVRLFNHIHRCHKSSHDSGNFHFRVTLYQLVAGSVQPV